MNCIPYPFKLKQSQLTFLINVPLSILWNKYCPGMLYALLNLSFLNSGPK